MKLTKEMVQRAYEEEKATMKKWEKVYEEEINKGNQEEAKETMEVIELHHNRMQEAFDLLSKLASRAKPFFYLS